MATCSESSESEYYSCSSDDEVYSQSSFPSTSSEEDSSDLEDLQGNFFGLEPYQFEPERDARSSDSKESSSEAEDVVEEQKVGRLGNKDWCTCNNCRVEMREIDCLCCKEVSAIKEGKFSGQFQQCLKIKQHFFI